MGGLTDVDRGILARATPAPDERQISRVAASGDTSQRQQATADALHGADLWRRLIEQHWPSDRARQLYTKDYLVASAQRAGGAAPTEDQLYAALLDWERRYQDHQRKVAEEARLLAEKASLSARGAANPIAASEFQPGVIPLSLAQARADPRWCERDIIEATPRIQWHDRTSATDWRIDAQWLRLHYADGAALDVPLDPRPLLFREPLADGSDPFFRRHRASGRLVPFQVTAREFANLPPTAPIGDTLSSLPPRFDPYLTPKILEWRDLANSRSLADQFGALTQAFGTMSAAGGLSALRPDTLLGAGRAIVTPVARTTVAASTLARSALQEIQVAVVTYRHISATAAIAYLGRSAWTFYLREAVSLTTIGIVGTEVVLSLAGADMGPVSQGDQLSLAVQEGKGAWRALRVEVEEVDVAAKAVRARITRLETAAADEVADVYDGGRMIHHVKAPPRPAATAVDDAKITARAVDDPATGRAARAVDDTGVVNAPKGKPRRPSAPPPPAYDIHHVQLLSDTDIEKLRAIGVKPEALEKLRSIEAGELQRMALKPAEITNLYRSLRASQARGGVVVDFINGFHTAPGFQAMVLNWARGGAGRQGANFAMRYALKKLQGQAVRFEWPVAYAVTSAGNEASMAARYVDIVLDGGTNLRPGQALRIELKSWTARYLSTARATKTVARQLVRDTAFFGRDNIRWVFDASKARREEVIAAFIRTIREDPVLKVQWEGTDDEIRAVIERLIEMFR